jgi:hypothetical protein
VFESCQGHECLSLVNTVCCIGRGLCDGPIPRPEEWYRVCVCVRACVVCVCVRERVSFSVIKHNNNPLHLQQTGRKDHTKMYVTTKERYIEKYSESSQEYDNWEKTEVQILRESYRKLIRPVV